MKDRSYFLLLVLLTLACAGCKERMIVPVVPPSGDRVVLLEEFTGKGCTNCPKGSREIENLLSLYGEHLVAVSIHANFFANPQFFPLGQYDLRTDEGEALFDFLGPNYGYPAGVIDRRKFNGDFQLGANVWAGFVAEEVLLEPEVGLTIDHLYDPLSRQLDLVVKGIARTSIQVPLRISVMLTESGIVDAQDDAEAGGIVEDYVHNHVLRDMMTPYDGQELVQSLEAGEDFSVPFGYVIPQEWDADHCSVIAFVSRGGGGDIYVLQAAEVYVID